MLGALGTGLRGIECILLMEDCGLFWASGSVGDDAVEMVDLGWVSLQTSSSGGFLGRISAYFCGEDTFGDGRIFVTSCGVFAADTVVIDFIDGTGWKTSGQEGGEPGTTGEEVTDVGGVSNVSVDGSLPCVLGRTQRESSMMRDGCVGRNGSCVSEGRD